MTGNGNLHAPPHHPSDRQHIDDFTEGLSAVGLYDQDDNEALLAAPAGQRPRAASHWRRPPGTADARFASTPSPSGPAPRVCDAVLQWKQP